MTARETLAPARQFYRHGEADRAIQLIAQISTDHEWTTTDLVMKVRLIQLASESSSFTLDDAVECLRLANAQEPTNPIPLMELAFFESRVLGSTEEAQIKFAEAGRIISKQLGECYGGLIEARDLEGASVELATCELLERTAGIVRSSIDETLSI